jgi:hypothetical protein
LLLLLLLRRYTQHATKLPYGRSTSTPSAAASAMRVAICRCWAGLCLLATAAVDVVGMGPSSRMAIVKFCHGSTPG